MITAIAVVAAIAWLVVRGGGRGESRLEPRADPYVASAPYEAAPAGPANAPDPAGSDGAMLPAATRSLAEEDATAANDADGLAIVVVDARDGSRCSRARLFAFWGVDGWRFGNALVDDSILAERCGSAYRADDDGRARIRPRGGSDWVVALHGDSWGLGRLDPLGPSPLQISVAQCDALAVEVVDARGAPTAAVSLELGKLRPGDGRRNDLLGRFIPFVESTSDADGRARFRGLEFVPAVLPDGELTVVASTPLAPQVTVAVPPREERDRSGKPLRVTLPPMGTVHVRLVDATGELVKVDTRLTVMSRAGAPLHSDLQSRIEGGKSAPIAVGVGGEVTAFITPPGHAQLKNSSPGPAFDGDAITLDVVVPSTNLVSVIGSVVLEDGTPWHGPLQLRWLIPTEQKGRWENPGHSTTSDESGGFASEIADSAFRFAPPSVTFVITDHDGFERASERLTLPELRNQESIDLGEAIVLRGAGVVVDGIVVDRNGAPVPGVHLMAERTHRPDDDPLDQRNFITSVVEVSKEGRFRVALPRPDDELDVTAFGTIEGWLASGHARWHGGEREIRIVLVERGSVAVRALLPDGLPSDSVHAGLRLPEWRGREKEQLFSSMALANELEAALQSDAGVVDVVVRCRSDRRPLVEVNDVVVEPGKVTRDPRVAAIDLRGLLRVVTLSILDADGAPASGGSVRIYEAGHLTVPVDSLRLAGKPFELVTRSPLDLLIQARGCRSHVVRGVEGDCTIQLERSVGVTVRLHFDDLPPLEGSQRWWVRLHRLETPLDRSEWPIARLDEEGECEFAVDDPGDYEFTLQRDFEVPREVPNPRVLIKPDRFTIPVDPTESTLDLDIEPIE